MTSINMFFICNQRIDFSFGFSFYIKSLAIILLSTVSFKSTELGNESFRKYFKLVSSTIKKESPEAYFSQCLIFRFIILKKRNQNLVKNCGKVKIGSEFSNWGLLDDFSNLKAKKGDRLWSLLLFYPNNNLSQLPNDLISL